MYIHLLQIYLKSSYQFPFGFQGGLTTPARTVFSTENIPKGTWNLDSTALVISKESILHVFETCHT